MKTKTISADVSSEDFVKIWQTAKSLAEVVKKTGQSKHTSTVRAANFRRRGIPLKQFRIYGLINQGMLKKIALKYAPK